MSRGLHRGGVVRARVTRTSALLALGALGALAACGGGNPFSNPEAIDNPAGALGQRLAFAYFQRCVQPVLTSPQPGASACAAGGCHDSATGTGGALRLEAGAAQQDLAQDAATLRASAMYRNFYSAQGVAVIGAPDASLLLNKPRLAGVLHGGGLIFHGDDSEAVRRLAYWIGRPMPQGQDEFSVAAASMFEADGACKS